MNDALSFALERVGLALLSQLTMGQEVALARESESCIAVTADGQTIGYVPSEYRPQVAVVIRRGDYTAEIEDIAHHLVRVRVTS